MTGALSGNSHAPGKRERPESDSSPAFSGTLILGHRGSPRAALENTLASFDLALRGGADGVELDVRRSRDGRPVVLHDDSMERGFGLTHRVSQLDWPAIERLTEARLPSFEQVAAWAGATGAWLNVEFKSPGVEAATLERVREVGIRDRVIISSFHPEIVRAVGRIDDRVRRFFLTERWNEEARQKLGLAGASGVCLRDDGASPGVLDELRDLGLPVVVWTVNDPGRIRALLEAGVAGIISDVPAVAADIRREFMGA